MARKQPGRIFEIPIQVKIQDRIVEGQSDQLPHIVGMKYAKNAMLTLLGEILVRFQKEWVIGGEFCGKEKKTAV